MIDLKMKQKVLKMKLIDIRRTLHENPEIGYEEINTSKFIKDFLTREGITIKNMQKQEYVALIKGNKKLIMERLLVLRADIDALPLEDKKSCSYASKDKRKDACMWT